MPLWDFLSQYMTAPIWVRLSSSFEFLYLDSHSVRHFVSEIVKYFLSYDLADYKSQDGRSPYPQGSTWVLGSTDPPPPGTIRLCFAF